MNHPTLPKVLFPINGKPMIAHVLAAVQQAAVGAPAVFVIGQHGEQIRGTLGPQYQYVTQAEPRGTAHAVAAARSMVEGKADHILVLYGDHPFITAPMIRRLAEVHRSRRVVITMGTITVPDFEGWRSSFADFGRVLRDPDGTVRAIVERRDATPAQEAIREVSPSYFCFRSAWLWKNLARVRNENAQMEYYLPDLVRIAREDGEALASVPIDPHEGLGINTLKQLEHVRHLAT